MPEPEAARLPETPRSRKDPSPSSYYAPQLSFSQLLKGYSLTNNKEHQDIKDIIFLLK